MIALIAATALLALAAVGGKEIYIVFYFFAALLFSGLRYTKEGKRL